MKQLIIELIPKAPNEKCQKFVNFQLKRKYYGD